MVGETVSLGEVGFSDSVAEKIDGYLAYLLEWNRKIRLTGHDSLSEARTNLVLDPLFAFLAFQDRLPPGDHFDFGSGNGSPGLVLSILDPLRQYFLIEKTGKKRAFLEYVRRHLDLRNLEVLPAFSSECLAPTVWMKGITYDDFFLDRPAQMFMKPPVRFFRFGLDTHPSCIPVRTYAINGTATQWGKNHSLFLLEAVFQG